MKVACRQPDLSRGLSIVGHAVSSRSTLPILANILLTAEGDRLKLAATNLEIGINYWIDAKVTEDGSITIPAKLLTDLVNSLPDDTLELSLPPDSTTVTMKSRMSAANIKGIEASEFPAIPSADGGEQPIHLDAATLRTMATEVCFAAATDDTRPIFTGVLCQILPQKITFAAADSYRLAVRSAVLSTDEHPTGDIIIPARTLSEVARVVPQDEKVEIIVTPNRSQVLFHTKNLELVSRLIDGQFPNYTQIIPKSHATRAVINTADFRAIAKSASLFARDGSNIVRLQVEPAELEPGKITLRATADELGDNTGTINAVVEGKGIPQIIFNVKYLTEVLNVIDSNEIALEVTNPNQPGVIRPISESDYTYVIMPMHSVR